MEQDQPVTTPLVVAATFINAMEAEVAASALTAAGIPALVRRDDCGGIRPSLWLSGIDVIVRACDETAARLVLDAPTIGIEASATPDEAERRAATKRPGPSTMHPTIYDFHAIGLDGTSHRLDEYRGRVMLIVNVASACGYTPQYAGLETLFRTYRDRGFVVLGFPCNQFGRQEPGTHEEIAAFCAREYAVTFPLFRKVDVNGPDAHPLFAFLKSKKKGLLGSQAIKWNFTKFLVGADGEVLERYGSGDTPAIIEHDVVAALEHVSRDDGASRRPFPTLED